MSEYKFKINGKEYTVSVNGIEGKNADVTVNGVQYAVELENAPVAAPAPTAAPAPAAAAAPAPAAAPAAAGEGRAVNSPLPGVIVDVCVKEGDTVNSGDVIGSIGDTAEIEAAEPSHLHFALKRNGEWIDPVGYIDPFSNK